MQFVYFLANWPFITSACSLKSTLSTLGLLVGHLTPWRAALVATASSVVAYYENRRKGNRQNSVITSQPTQAVKTDSSRNRWKQMDENAEVKIIMQMLLLNFLTYSCENIPQMLFKEQYT